MDEVPEESPAGDAEDDAPHSGSNFDGEDFLFHLYRGSELLQDNCIPEAKEELEAALRVQPRDVEGQGLLGVVYFRLGHYDRAIAIYEELVKACPTDLTPKVNLALCYMKTGLFPDARAQLEAIIRQDSDHLRAWGYLGLVFQRLGDYAKAQAAFERAQQPRLARRMTRLLEEGARRDSHPPDREALQAAAADAVEELHVDDAQNPFSLEAAADEAPAPSRSGRWKAIELGEEPLPPPGRPLRATPSDAPPPPADPTGSVRPASLRPPIFEEAPTARQLAERTLLAFPEKPTIALHRDQIVLARVEDRFAVRVGRVRAMVSRAGAFATEPLRRRARGRELDEPLGGIASPIVSLRGIGNLVLAPTAGRAIVAVQLQDEFLYVREDFVIGFEPDANYENGRMGVGDGEFVAMLQFSGAGAVVVESRGPIEAVELTPDGSSVVRGDSVLGWTGRLFPRAVPSSEAPTGTRGLVTFSGTGAVYLQGD